MSKRPKFEYQLYKTSFTNYTLKNTLEYQVIR